MRVALIQQANSDDWHSNLQHSLTGIGEAAEQGAALVLLQELHGHRYPCQCESAALFDLAEPIPGPSSEQLSQAAKQHNIVIVGSLFERRAAGLYHNTAVVFDASGDLCGCYRKMHIPDDPGYYEKYYFTPGDLGFQPIATPLGKLGVLVCWDQWFPEAARLMALAGAELLLYPTAIGWDPRDEPAEQSRQHTAWQLVQRGHAVANGLPVLVCNRVGHEPDPSEQTPGSLFWGGSFVCGPQGELLAEAGTDLPAVLLAEIDLAHTETIRRTWPFLRDRRIDAYAELSQRWRD